MIKVAFFDTKPYDKKWFDEVNAEYEIEYFENRLNSRTAALAAGCEAVIPFVNDTVDAQTIDILFNNGVKLIAMRSAGYNNVDVKAAYKKINIVRVPEYSPNAVAEHAIALLMTLNRRIHKAYNRTRDFNFSLAGLTGFDLNGKTVGVIGTGKIGRVFINICRGFGTNVLAYDPYPNPSVPAEYVELDRLFAESDIISLHCPLNENTKHIVNSESIKKMKRGVFIVNTSRGALIESEALLKALNDEYIGGAALDVYEEEGDIFFEDYSSSIIKDDVLSILVSRPNVIITSHQGFLTNEALKNIALTTIENLDDFFAGRPLVNEVCYRCKEGREEIIECRRDTGKRCF